jgi:hypothetical protein
MSRCLHTVRRSYAAAAPLGDGSSACAHVVEVAAEGALSLAKHARTCVLCLPNTQVNICDVVMCTGASRRQQQHAPVIGTRSTNAQFVVRHMRKTRRRNDENGSCGAGSSSALRWR